MSFNVTKVIMPLAGLGTRFLPLSKVVPKELWPLGEKPVMQYIIDEALASGIKEFVFVLSPEKKIILDYLKPAQKLEKVLEQRQKTELLKELRSMPLIDFKVAYQRKPKGDGDAILKAGFSIESLVKAGDPISDTPYAVLFGDDLIWGEEPALAQLLSVFRNYHQPIICLARVPREKFSHYGMVACEKIANRLYKIKGIVEKPSPENSPSDLAIVGKYIITPEVFKYLKETKPTPTGEIILANAFSRMLKQGKLIYGYEVKGEWLECGTKKDYIKTFLKIANMQRA